MDKRLGIIKDKLDIISLKNKITTYSTLKMVLIVCE